MDGWRLLSLVRRSFSVLWGCLVAFLIIVSLGGHIPSILGLQTFIIRGGSMQPAIPLGALVVVQPTPGDDLQVNDVVTLRTARNVIVTHRIVGIEQGGSGETLLRTRGDASSADDQLLTPASAVFGRVVFSAPMIGYVLAFVSTPGGGVSALMLIGAILVFIRFIDEIERRAPRARRSTGVAQARA